MEQLHHSIGHQLKNQYISQKLNFVLGMLNESKDGYERIATEQSDRDMRKTIAGLALECGQYANELNCQIQSLGGKPVLPDLNENALWGKIGGATTFSCNEDVLRACNKAENILVKAYREVLNDPNLYQNLRNMMTYQLNGILYAFTKVKLLNTTIRRAS
jgi:uncharacterized protein (TIGR02284 family)